MGLVIFVGLSSRVLPSLLRLQGAILQIRGSSEAAKNFLIEFREATNQFIALGSTKLGSDSGKVKSVDFSSQIILHDAVAKHSQESDFRIGGINLEIHKGEFFAIAGRSGSGKTTLADLMLGIINLESGEVTIGGFPPSEAIQKWPNKIRYVPQDVHLIPGTILENVMWPDLQSSLSDSKLQELFDVAELSPWLRTLEKGWNTEINSLGNNLSGGQKQRIGIARALYSSPSILFLDESTSSLDVQTEQEIVNNIIVNMKNITRIVIAHRISTIRCADRIAYLKDGLVVSIGTYSELKEQIPDFDSD
jgi:ABC-type bacteriocin/lantibiotic exporter with double-glycine peptidase domain